MHSPKYTYTQKYLKVSVGGRLFIRGVGVNNDHGYTFEKLLDALNLAPKVSFNHVEGYRSGARKRAAVMHAALTEAKAFAVILADLRCVPEKQHDDLSRVQRVVGVNAAFY